jgi:tubulin-specific chaperone D
MDEVEKEQDEERFDIQASYLTVIKEFRSGLLQWLAKESQSGEIEEFEDRSLDALLLKVSPFTNTKLTQIEPFQEQPHLLDTSLQSLIDPLIPYLLDAVNIGFNVRRQQCFRVMYHYTKIRGHKVASRLVPGKADIVRFLPNDVYLLEPVLASVSITNLQWQTTYILLLWLSLICLAPFDLASIESLNDGRRLITRLIDLAKRGLGSGGKERDACAILCARVLSRSDVWRHELGSFMRWAIDIFSSPEQNILLV